MAASASSNSPTVLHMAKNASAIGFAPISPNASSTSWCFAVLPAATWRAQSFRTLAMRTENCTVYRPMARYALARSSLSASLSKLFMTMAEDDPQQEPTPTQLTQPKGKDKDGNPAEPIEIPVPKVSTIRAAIRKLAQPVTPSGNEK